jgi:hypothetical protein
MKVYFTILFVFAFKLYGQTPVHLKYYLNSIQISKTAKDFYYGKFKASDDIKTFSIIDSLNTKNNFTRPFYIFLVSKIIDNSDGALSESLSTSCKNFIELHPDFLIDFLFSKNKIVEKRFTEKWAKQIAEEVIIDCEEKDMKCIKKSFQQALLKSRMDNKMKLADFYQKIKNYSR